MKKFLLVLTLACMYKTSIHAGPDNHEMYRAALWGSPWRISTEEIPTPASIPFDVVHISLPIITRKVHVLKEELKGELEKQKSQAGLAQFLLNNPKKLIDHLITLELVKLALNKAESWGNSKKVVADKAKVLETLTAEIDAQNYDNLVTILQANKAYRLSCIEKLQLVERARVYKILNNFKTERSIKLKFKYSDEDKNPDSGFVTQRETSKNIVQLLQVKLYRNKN